MNLPDFRALLAEFALAHPERPLAEVTVVEFAEWSAARPVPKPPSRSAFRDFVDVVERMGGDASALFPSLIIQDEASTLTPEQAQYLRASAERWKARKGAAQQVSYTFRMTEEGGKILQEFAETAAADDCLECGSNDGTHYPRCSNEGGGRFGKKVSK